MTRAKVKLAFMQRKAARKSTLNKRKRGLIKKVHELSTLCGVESCVVIYSPNCSEPDLWPSHPATENVIQRYRDMSAFEKSKNMADQESFGKQELAKALEQLNKVQKENRLKELSIIVNENMRNNREWVRSLNYDYLTYINNHVLKPQLEEMERKIALFNQEPSATSKE